MQASPALAVASQEVRPLIAAFLERVDVMTIATSSGQRPWTATVYVAADEELHLYFVSNRQARHAKELLDNPWLAAALYDPGSVTGKARGLQLEGQAAPIQASELARALTTYSRRFPWARRLVSNPIHFLSDAAQARLFRIVPDRMWYLDEERFGLHGRREWTRNPASVHRTDSLFEAPRPASKS